jgi:hypothetical protein
VCSSPDGIRPLSDSPQKQSDFCLGCAQSAFGTGKEGEGQAAAATAEERAAVWLAASLWDFLNPSPEPWHGETHALAGAGYFATLAFLRERNLDPSRGTTA